MCIRRRICEGLNSNLNDIRPRQSRPQQCADRVAIRQAAFEIAHVMMRIKGEQPTTRERQIKRVHSRVGDGVVPAKNRDGNSVRRRFLDALDDPKKNFFDRRSRQSNVADIRHRQ
jgi:hypothetical protein